MRITQVAKKPKQICVKQLIIEGPSQSEVKSMRKHMMSTLCPPLGSCVGRVTQTDLVALSVKEVQLDME